MVSKIDRYALLFGLIAVILNTAGKNLFSGLGKPTLQESVMPSVSPTSCKERELLEPVLRPEVGQLIHIVRQAVPPADHEWLEARYPGHPRDSEQAILSKTNSN